MQRHRRSVSCAHTSTDSLFRERERRLRSEVYETIPEPSKNGHNFHKDTTQKITHTYMKCCRLQKQYIGKLIGVMTYCYDDATRITTSPHAVRRQKCYRPFKMMFLFLCPDIWPSTPWIRSSAVSRASRARCLGTKTAISPELNIPDFERAPFFTFCMVLSCILLHLILIHFVLLMSVPACFTTTVLQLTCFCKSHVSPLVCNEVLFSFFVFSPIFPAQRELFSFHVKKVDNATFLPPYRVDGHTQFLT